LRSYAQLEAENKLLREQVKIIGALHMIERFHAFDAIKDDACPCCGGRVVVEQDQLRRDGGQAITLRAVS
jgi:hypothetical protein